MYLRLGSLALLAVASCWGLNPHKTLTQFARTTWTQQHGLPQDTVRAIAQTADSYLWLGTDEGLARFDGYEFHLYNKAHGDVPANSISALAAGADGTLWIGTSKGLTRYANGKFHTFTIKDGLPDDAVTQLWEDHTGTLWIVAGIHLSSYRNGTFTNFAPGKELPLVAARIIREDRKHTLWVVGFTTVVKKSGDKFVQVMDAAALNGNIISTIVFDRHGNFWLGGNKGVLVRLTTGEIRRFSESDGLPDQVRALWEDRDGNIWAGTNRGLARYNGKGFEAAAGEAREADTVRCLYEDREGDMWVGSNSGLTRYRDTVFTVYGETEGLPSNEPNTLFQDSTGRIWVGFHGSGLMLFGPGPQRVYTTRDGLPNNDIFSIREAANGDLLIGARDGMARMHDGHFTTFVPPDPLERTIVFDALEDGTGRIWMATAAGLTALTGGKARTVVPAAPLVRDLAVTLCATRDGAIWAGTNGKGLWRVKGEEMRQFTAAEGLSSDQIRSLYEEPDGTLWIGTFGGGLDEYRDGKVRVYMEKDGLLSDNVSRVTDDGESLWLSTTRGICRIPKGQLRDFAAHRRVRLEPMNYDVEDGLRSAQCSPAYPLGGGGNRTADGRLWFTTARGLAVFTPEATRTSQAQPLAPAVHIVEMAANGRALDLSRPARLDPSSERIQIRYTGIHLSAPERVQYSYLLEGIDTGWVRAGGQRVIDYNSLAHGKYRFRVRAEIAGGLAGEQSYAFEVLPRFYETALFRLLAGAMLLAVGWAGYQLRLRQMRSRFALVLEERARIAREIHDTLAQGYVGISSQLDAVAMCMQEEATPARQFLELARRMARHSLTEARRAVMDLRSVALDNQDLASALEGGARLWTTGSNVKIEVEVQGGPQEIPEEMEQHLLRIAQEAVANAMKHAAADRIWIRLHMEARKLYLSIKDNGRGCDQDGVFSTMAGHFGLIGMRERAERLGGELRLTSQPGEGTEVEVRVPLP